MGIDCYARALVGVRVARKDVFDLLVTQKTVRGCSHPPPGDIPLHEYKFCHQCGAPFEKVVSVSDDKAYAALVDKKEFYGLKAVSPSYKEDDFIIGLLYVSSGSHQFRSDAIGCISLGKAEFDIIGKIYNQVKDVLKPLKLWEEEKFGLYVVQTTNY